MKQLLPALQLSANPPAAIASYAAHSSCHCCCCYCYCCRFVLRHPLVASAVIGASTQQQLQELLAAAGDGPLQDEQLLEAIDVLHQRYPNPTP